jgi:hypothetical protein
MADRIEGFAFHVNTFVENTHNRLHILPDRIENTAEAFRLMSIYRAITAFTLTCSIASINSHPIAKFQLLKDKIIAEVQ